MSQPRGEHLTRKTVRVYWEFQRGQKNMWLTGWSVFDENNTASVICHYVVNCCDLGTCLAYSKRYKGQDWSRFLLSLFCFVCVCVYVHKIRWAGKIRQDHDKFSKIMVLWDCCGISCTCCPTWIQTHKEAMFPLCMKVIRESVKPPWHLIFSHFPQLNSATLKYQAYFEPIWFIISKTFPNIDLFIIPLHPYTCSLVLQCTPLYQSFNLYHLECSIWTSKLKLHSIYFSYFFFFPHLIVLFSPYFLPSALNYSFQAHSQPSSFLSTHLSLFISLFWQTLVLSHQGRQDNTTPSLVYSSMHHQPANKHDRKNIKGVPSQGLLFSVWCKIPTNPVNVIIKARKLSCNHSEVEAI